MNYLFILKPELLTLILKVVKIVFGHKSTLEFHLEIYIYHHIYKFIYIINVHIYVHILYIYLFNINVAKFELA